MGFPGSWQRVCTVAVAAVMSFSACASAPPLPHGPDGPPQLRALTEESSDGPRIADFVAADGVVLPVRQWLPEPGQKWQGIIIALHGFNDYSHAFAKVPDAPGAGPYLAAQGFAVFAYDQRGFGKAPGFGYWADVSAMTGDLTTFAKLMRARYPAVPLYGLGESMGGAVMLTALAGSNPPPLDGAVLVAPAVWGRATMPALYRLALWFGDHFMPGLRPSGRGLGRQASDNIAMLRANGRDPLFIKNTRIDTIAGLVNLMDGALAASAHQTIPELYLCGAHDEIIPPKAADLAMHRLLATDPHARGAYYDTAWHMMLRDLDAAEVLNDIVAWLKDPAATLPSGATHDALLRLDARAKEPWVQKKK